MRQSLSLAYLDTREAIEGLRITQEALTNVRKHAQTDRAVKKQRASL